jgi:hypothetical protein
MACRRAFRRGSFLALSLVVLAAWDGRALGQSTLTRSSSSGSSSSSSGSSASSVGGGFTGGGSSAGGGFTGGSGSGSASSSSGGFTGGGSSTSGGTGFTGGGSYTSGSGTAVPSTVNPFLSTYVNPLTVGMLDVTGKQTVNKAFGQPMFNVFSTATTGSTNSSFGNIGGMGGTNSANSATNFGFNTFGMSRTPNYAAVLSSDMPRVVHANPQLQAQVTDLLSRSTSLQTSTPINVSVKDGTVTLEGSVASAKDRRLIEGMTRLTPGVRNVVNNLEVTETLPAPNKGPAPMGP